ncbi:bifunctional diaminohydroxyphosphoribosylaminopyrimidine deaminase/5-amino-6-(5-phosphoribosylamino)uracil reductase RibD [Rubrolithibacter danxiaensis]|uniref:bifunctional diaminohydroxyphosphoribosylaminopyrimidine deaminase/5-amino-6-(5-phosphoribosylamino)uracil reductase RibD n=1 Tax=Rubrolithibacter danxiaensis TaxID=3390805 RepID=UPI003BF7FE30
MQAHEKYMQRCIDLALLAKGNVSPNPMVGAVVVHNGEIIGEGYHQRFGDAHAEVNAINKVLAHYANAAELLKQSTLYVSLEPCAHFGKTPPCSELIIRHEIPRVVIGCADPFPEVDGKGIGKLRDKGIDVTVGVLKNDCENLNKRFFTHVKKQRPYLILKWAQTADGFFAPENGLKKWISSPLSKKLVHQWRSEEDAVLVGKNTALIDNPQLNVREIAGRNPLRIVIDRNLELPFHLHLFDQSQETIVFNSVKTTIEDKIKYLEIEDFDNYLPQLISYQLFLMDIQSVIIEGGKKTLDLFLKAGLWDEARVFISKDRWSSGIHAPLMSNKATEIMEAGSDSLSIFLNKN